MFSPNLKRAKKAFAPFLLVVITLLMWPVASLESSAQSASLEISDTSIVQQVSAGATDTVSITLTNQSLTNMAFQISTSHGTESQESAGSVQKASASNFAIIPSPRAQSSASPLTVQYITKMEAGAAGAEFPIPQRYVIDDGTSNGNFGYSAAADYLWMNTFEAVEERDTVGRIAVAWGIKGGDSNIDEGRIVRALLFEDPNDDGEPSDAVLLADTTVRVILPDTDFFTVLDIGPAEVTGRFFIAMLYEDLEHSEYPAAFDIDGGFPESSWYAVSDPGTFNLDNLAANEVPPRRVPIFDGNWLLRADAPGPDYVGLEPSHGLLAPGEEVMVSVMVDASALTPGTYPLQLVVSNSDVDYPQRTIDVTLEVLAPISKDPIGIAEAREMAGRTVTIEGIITTPDYGFDTGQFYIQDETGGIKVVSPGEGGQNNETPFNRSDEVLISGEIGASNGQVQITLSEHEMRSTGNQMPGPTMVGADDFSVESPLQGSLVMLEQVILTVESEWPTEKITSGSGVTVYVRSADMDTFAVRIDRDESYYDGTPRPDGYVNLTGVLGGFQDEAQVMPFSEGDLVAVAGPVASVPNAELPVEFALLGNYPNPFNPSTTIRFDLAAAARVVLTIYDVMGRDIMRIDGGVRRAGARQELPVNADGLATGVYVYNLRAEAAGEVHQAVGRMLLIK